MHFSSGAYGDSYLHFAESLSCLENMQSGFTAIGREISMLWSQDINQKVAWNFHDYTRS